MHYFKTPAAARFLEVSYWRLIGLLRSGRLTPPHKDTSGDYIWTNADLVRAHGMLTAGRPSAKLPAEGGLQ